ncbi:MAG TPA: aspartyl/asparaginyl beta-hydroxylase domain-containing protein [Tahibacter sp.]|nr:aspartyl/asparaginyl beta-hydroxylase domain-containing protein [Tahibacter sp.]
MKYVIFLLLVLPGVYVHLRGRVRLRPWRQMTDHSTFLAPINVLLYACSRVTAKPYAPLDAFPELAPLAERWRDIRDEALALREAQRIRASERYDDVGFNSFFRRGWKRFYLKWYDDAHPSARELCPRTTALVAAIPTVKAAMFAELPPGASLRKHRDPYAGSLRYHLGLVTPGDDRCYIEVDGRRYSWRDGEAVMFDETFIHRAENATAHDRIILFCDVERPLRFGFMRAFNRWFAKTVIAAGASPNMEGDKTGALNRAFAYVYKVKQHTKRLRKTRKKLYYTIKFTLIALVLLAILWP